MGCIPYQNVEDAARSLRQTVILYKGAPAFVRTVDGPAGVVTPDQITLHLNMYPVKSRVRLEVQLDDPALDITNMRVGYINTDTDAVWCERFPYQGTTQGLNNNNINTRTVNAGTGKEPHWSFSDLMEIGDINQMFVGGYPRMQEVVAKFNESDSVRSIAFNRIFAVSRDEKRGDFLIHYKGEAAGGGDLSRGFTLGRKFTYLKEQLQELGINVAA